MGTSDGPLLIWQEEPLCDETWPGPLARRHAVGHGAPDVCTFQADQYGRGDGVAWVLHTTHTNVCSPGREVGGGGGVGTGECGTTKCAWVMVDGVLQYAHTYMYTYSSLLCS